MNIHNYIGETTEYDKKVLLEIKKPKSWLKSVSAFANGIGGALLFGISNEGDLIGLDNAERDSETISEQIKQKMDPIPQTILEIHKEDEKTFIILKVLAGQETPYYYVADGNRIAFVRIGNESVPADSITLKRLVLKGSGKTYDSLSSGFRFSNSAFTKLRSAFKTRVNTELTDSDFVSFGLVDESGYLTNAGALLADDSLIKHSRLFCTRWNGLDKASGVMDALDDKEFSGSLISLLQNGVEFVINNSKKSWKKTADGRIEMPEYPERAVLECLVNALIHRDYSELGSEVHIDIFDDRLEIYSPGGMMDGSVVQNLDKNNVPSKRRNPVIADIFSRIRYMERRGSGFRKVIDAYHSSENYRDTKEPKFISNGTAFFVTLYNLNYRGINKKIDGVNAGVNDGVNDGVKITKNSKKILAMLCKDGSLTAEQIASELKVSVSTVERSIKQLKDNGLIERVGSDKSGYWKVR